MSSFEVGSHHISAILTWAIDQDLLGVNSPQSWFRLFYQENLDSVNYRYRENNQIPHKAKYRPIIGVLNSRYPREIAIAIYKLACCWSYNSCDHKYNEQDLVWLEMAKVEKQAIALSGLAEETILDSEEGEKAPWCYSDKDWKKYIAWVRERKKLKVFSPKVLVFTPKATIKAIK